MTGAIVPPKNVVQTWERYCIEVPLPTQEWRALITGALLDLSYGYYYDKSTGDWEYARDLGKEIVARWGERVGCGSLCQFVLTAIQNSPDVNTFLLLIIKELIRSCTQDIIDTFQEWFDGIDFGNGDYDDREDRTKARKRTGTDGNTKRCLAAENAAEVFYRLHVQSLTEIIGDINPFALITALGSVLAEFFGFTPNMVFFASIASAIAVIGLTGTKELFTEGVKDELKCLFYDAYDETGGISEGAWSTLQDAIDSRGETKPFPEATMWVLLSLYVKQFAGYRGTVTAGASTFITEPDCNSCPDNWCYVYNFDDNGLQEWTDTDDYGLTAVPSGGIGCNSGVHLVMSTACNFTRIEYNYKGTGTSASGNARIQTTGYETLAEHDSDPIGDPEYTIVWTGDRAMDWLRVGNGIVCATGSSRISFVKLFGYGENQPPHTYECT